MLGNVFGNEERVGLSYFEAIIPPPAIIGPFVLVLTLLVKIKPKSGSLLLNILLKGLLILPEGKGLKLVLDPLRSPCLPDHFLVSRSVRII